MLNLIELFVKIIFTCTFSDKFISEKGFFRRKKGNMMGLFHRKISSLFLVLIILILSSSMVLAPGEGECADGLCGVPPVCDDGDRICSGGGSYKECSGGQYDGDAIACDDLAPVCHGGNCMVCVPGAEICSGAGIPQLCTDDGSAWENQAACGDVEICRKEGECWNVIDGLIDIIGRLLQSQDDRATKLGRIALLLQGFFE